MSEPAAEPGLIQARAFLADNGLLARDSALGISPPPGRPLGRLQFFQPLPLLGRDQHDRIVARTGCVLCSGTGTSTMVRSE
jgi:hypothetical protein